MRVPATVIGILLAAFLFLVAACDSEPSNTPTPGRLADQASVTITPAPERLTDEASVTITPAPERLTDEASVTITPAPERLTGEASVTITPAPERLTGEASVTITPELEYFTGEIEPCTPVDGYAVDPCEGGVRLSALDWTGGIMASSPVPGSEPAPIRSFLERSLGYTPHIILRGTYLPDTLRCAGLVPYHTPSYREPGYTQNLYHTECYADVRVNSYIVGSGPSKLTVLVAFDPWFAHELVRMAEAGGRSVEEQIAFNRFGLEHIFGTGIQYYPESTGIGGREAILFIGPSHNAATEVWEVFNTWDIQRNDDNEVVVIHPSRDRWELYQPDTYQTHIDKLEMSLAAFTTAASAAHQALVTEYGGRIGPSDADGKARRRDPAHARNGRQPVGPILRCHRCRQPSEGYASPGPASPRLWDRERSGAGDDGPPGPAEHSLGLRPIAGRQGHPQGPRKPQLEQGHQYRDMGTVSRPGRQPPWARPKGSRR